MSEKIQPMDSRLEALKNALSLGWSELADQIGVSREEADRNILVASYDESRVEHLGGSRFRVTSTLSWMEDGELVDAPKSREVSLP